MWKERFLTLLSSFSKRQLVSIALFLGGFVLLSGGLIYSLSTSGSKNDIAFEPSSSESPQINETKIAVDVEGADVFSSTKASGSSVLPAGTASIDVISQNATDSAKILITPTTLTDKVLTVTGKTIGKFTVSVKVLEPQDIKFDWFIIQ